MAFGGIGCGARCAKILLFVFNFIFWLSGAVLLGLGIWAYVDQSSLSEKLSRIISVAELADGVSLKTSAILFIAIGTFIFIVGFCGCWGAIKEVRCLLGVYIILLVIVIVCEIAAGVVAVVYRQKAEDALTNKSVEFLQGSYDSASTDRDIAWNYVMQEFKCCGINGPNDFKGSAYVNQNRTTPGNTAIVVSEYCCTSADGKPAERNISPKDVNQCMVDAAACQGSGGTCPVTNDHFYHAGCLHAMKEFIKDNYLIFIVIALVIAALELFGLLFAICLCRALGREGKEHY